MDESQLRAWRALALGPVWQVRTADLRGARQDAAPDTEREVAPIMVRDAGTRAQSAQSAGEVSPASMSWQDLRTAVAACRACALCRTRTQTVFGVGSERARWMLVGEAPGAEEDARGEPFVGQAGRLLDSMLAALGLGRERDVFIANVLKCRPPNNRNPEPEEVAHCEPFLKRQIELVAPQVIVVLGRFAAQSLLKTDASIASLRGKVHRYRIGETSVPLVVTYHPAYLLRNLADKAKAWADLCLARAALDAGQGGGEPPN